MRTTLTLDEDIAAKLRSLSRRTGRAFKDVVNDALRTGLANATPSRSRTPFKVKARDLGDVKPGVNLDNVGELLEHVEGPRHR